MERKVISEDSRAKMRYPYRRPWYLFNNHMETILPYFTSKIYQVPYERERLELEDGDFLDLDWIKKGSGKLLIISHALEGNSRDYFVERAAGFFSERGYDILIWHFRSCSKEINRLPRLYHVGDTDDLDRVINHGQKTGSYDQLFLMGFSFGGTVVLNYLAKNKIPEALMASAVFSVPLDLKQSIKKISSGLNKVSYGKSFSEKVKRKLEKKASQYPSLIPMNEVSKADSLEEIYDLLIKKLYNHASSDHYYSIYSGKNLIEKINSPLLLVNAQNDPLLGSESYPRIELDNVEAEYPRKGGHVGFSIHGSKASWMELRAESFFNGSN